MRFFWPDSYPILKRPGLNALRNAFQTDINLIAQTTSGGGGMGRIPDETGQVYNMHLFAGAREQGVLRVLQHPVFFCGQL